MHIKNTLKRLINSSGFELRRLNPRSNPAFQLLKALENFDIDLVFDIGANEGQFAAELRSVGYSGEIVSFEPLTSAHQAIEKISRLDDRWKLHEQCAIGDRDGHVEINIAENSVSSSILPILEAHTSAARKSSYIATERVCINRLDTVAPVYLETSKRPFLKIDTQGYEWQVLDGATQVLPLVKGLICELSLVPLYKGQRLWLGLIERLESEGFTLWAIQKGFTDLRDGRTLQINAIFFRTPEADG